MNVIIAYHKNNKIEYINTLHRFFQLIYQGDVSFSSSETTPINIIWLENILYGYVISSLFFYLIPSNFIYSFITGCLVAYFITSSYYSIGGFIGLYYLTQLLIYLMGSWIEFIFILSSILGSYLFAIFIAILEGDFYRAVKYNKYISLSSENDKYICFEIHTYNDNGETYFATDCISTFLLKWKISYDYHIGFVITGIYRLCRHIVYNNDIFIKK